MVDHDGKTVNNLTSDEAAEIKGRITEIMSSRVYYGPVNMYKDMAEYADTVGKKLDPYTANEVPDGVPRDAEGHLQPFENSIPEKIRITEIQGAKIIHPLLAICDKGDFTFVVANELIPGSFDKDEIDVFLNKLSDENQNVYENESSCRSACTGLCVGTCGNTCDGCYESCSNVCTGCGVCTGECSHMCGGSCTNSCKYACSDSCGGSCSGHCFGDCNTGCGLTCWAACGGGCTTGCTGTCKGGVGHEVNSDDESDGSEV